MRILKKNENFEKIIILKKNVRKKVKKSKNWTFSEYHFEFLYFTDLQ